MNDKNIGVSMLKNMARLEQVIGGRVYHLFCDNDSPLNELKEALVQFLSYANQLEAAIKAQQEEQKNKEAEVSVVAEEPKQE
jgi:hypothetical protein